ncbi:SGNH/GDSL hydrolase family protein [Marilutibacter aestuarii]|uniref:SGNH/GDSL hydrolase family protein n=1 Tax=Marilutibacter aestuarii TaxID=1706195 RepID=A0A508AYA3_9GAMM|nr:SGNH/GDSL hydrolase family protein [Lysobacter aestuarii]TQD50862.1 SGNH/GDSL hydrolase family protein [Lysobacter aestuarii]
MSLRPALCLMTALLLAWAAPSPGAPPARPLRILFVGNSHVATHDVPGLVATLAGRQGVVLDIDRLATPGYSLTDHLAGPRLEAALARPWDWVVLQQGPSARPASRAELIASTRAIAARLRGRPVRIALMSTWPDQRHRRDTLAAEASYREAARAIGACVLPVATAWRHALASDDPPRLYQGDRLHATAPGAVLAALAIVPAFTGGEGVERSIDAAASGDEARVLQGLAAAAARAYRDEPLRCH